MEAKDVVLESKRGLGNEKVRSAFRQDCDGENSETDSSLDFARDCGFLTLEQHRNLTGICKEVGKLFGSMISNPGPFLIS